VPFQYPFSIGKHTLNIAMHGDKYELRVDGMSFSHLYATKRAQSAFPSDTPPQRNTVSGRADPFGWDGGSRPQ
jgi:hypothetical protein